MTLRGFASRCGFPRKGKWLGLPLHYLFGAIPVGGNAL
jgi:hypothetical protein